MPFGSTAAGVMCSRDWTAECDEIQRKWDIIAPWALGVLIIIVMAVVIVAIKEAMPRRGEPRAAEELRHRLGPDAE